MTIQAKVRNMVERAAPDYAAASQLLPSDIEDLAELVRSEASSPTIKSKAVWLATFSSAPGALDVIRCAARDLDPLVRTAAAAALAHLVLGQGLEPEIAMERSLDLDLALQLAEDSDETVRLWADRALAQINTKQGDPGRSVQVAAALSGLYESGSLRSIVDRYFLRIVQAQIDVVLSNSLRHELLPAFEEWGIGRMSTLRDVGSRIRLGTEQRLASPLVYKEAAKASSKWISELAEDVRHAVGVLEFDWVKKEAADWLPDQLEIATLSLNTYKGELLLSVGARTDDLPVRVLRLLLRQGVYTHPPIGFLVGVSFGVGLALGHQYLERRQLPVRVRQQLWSERARDTLADSVMEVERSVHSDVMRRVSESREEFVSSVANDLNQLLRTRAGILVG